MTRFDNLVAYSIHELSDKLQKYLINASELNKNITVTYSIFLKDKVYEVLIAVNDVPKPGLFKQLFG